jgi:hypothetical protein
LIIGFLIPSEGGVGGLIIGRLIEKFSSLGDLADPFKIFLPRTVTGDGARHVRRSGAKVDPDGPVMHGCFVAASGL